MALLERARDSHDAAVARGEAAPTGVPKILPRRRPPGLGPEREMGLESIH